MAEVPVKVFVRVRPLLELERLKSSEECVQLVSQDQLVLGNDRSFRFDRIFHQNTAQSTVYECCVSPLLSSCLDGYNSTILAYGQTGSGKSFTLGSESSPCGYELSDNRGVIPRALDELFQLLESRCPTAKCRVTVSYIEIYKEELRDLLDGGGVAGGVVSPPLVIREDDHGNTVLLGAMELEVRTADEALGWLEVGNTARVTAATHMNHRSSRSHAVFTLHIEQRWKIDPASGGVGKEGVLSQNGGEAPVIEGTDANPGQLEQYVAAKFHFVDLAGSERASKTGNRGERFKESVHINSGLLALGNVISALGDPKRKSSHVPYRESKITRLLKDSLGGNARTSMIACLSPAADNFAENLNTLKYAKRARNIRNRPVMNKDPAVSRVIEMREEIASLRNELYRTQLSSSKPTTAATTVDTVDSSVMVELSDFEGHILELEAELQEARRQSQQHHHALSSIKDLIGQFNTEGVEEAGRAVVNSDLLKQIKHWLEHIENIEGGSNGSDPSSSVLTERAMETIRLLRRELERCHVDLQTDEELFAEKIEELNALQSAHKQLVREKERLEEMWLASQESEGLLQSEVFQLKEHLSSMARELAEREERERDGEMEEESAQGDEDSLTDVKPSEVFGELESSSQHQVIGEGGEAGGSGEGRGGGDDRFTATRSLLHGKVRTASLQDLSEEAVTQSLLALNSCLAQHILPHMQHSNSDAGHQRDVVMDASGSSDLNELRPTTPLETSQSEPLQSKSSGGHTHSPPTLLGGTYKIEDGRKILMMGGARDVALQQAEELDLLNESALESRRQLTTADEKLSRAQEEHRNLNLKIRLKEELIRELVKSSRSMKELNQSYVAKIQHLEKEASKVQRELVKTQGLLQRKHSQSSGSHEDRELVKLVEEHKKKLSLTEKKLKALQRKQKEAQCMVQSGGRSKRRIDDLESGIERLRNQQEMLKRKLKKQAERKLKLENDLQKYEVRMKSLQAHSEQQSKVLKRKTEEAAVAQRKLRQLNSGSRPSTHKEGESSERAWLDEEVERVLQRRRDIEALEKELSARERVIAEKEALIAERDELEAKKIRCSHSAARDIVRLSQQINTLEDSIRLRQERGGVKGRSKGDDTDKEKMIAKLSKERDELVKQCEAMREKVHDGALLPPDQEQRLYELNEHIEILEATINFKNSSINSQELHLAHLVTDNEEEAQHQSQLHAKLHSLSLQDAHALLVRYFHKVVRLRLEGGREEQRQREMKVELQGQRDVVRRLERSLRQTRADCERELLTQQKVHEKQVQVLIQQLAEATTPSSSEVASSKEEGERGGERIQALESKVKLLEKDLFYYKKTSRELKKRLQQSQSQAVGKRQKGGGREGGGREGKRELANVGTTEHGQNRDITRGEGVADSLEACSINEKSLTVSGTSLAAGTKRGENGATSGGGIMASSLVDGVSQAPPIATPTGEAQQQVIRKQKKQLRQLSASDVAALKHRKSKSSKDTS